MNVAAWLAQRKTWLALLTLAATVFVAYFPALGLGFYGDDWIFYDLAGRLTLSEYLVKYLDPRVQTAWYRPMHGALVRVEYALWGANTLGYHLRNMLIHLANGWLLFALVRRVTANVRVAFVAALIFASLPTAAQAVLWPGVIDPLETFFYLLCVWFWLSYLCDARRRDYWLAFGAFLLALLTKEIGVTLPITLFLFEQLVQVPKPSQNASVQMSLRASYAKQSPMSELEIASHKPLAMTDRAERLPRNLQMLLPRYIWFALVWLVYLPIEYIVTRRSVFVSQEGYTPGLQIFSNLLDYLSTLAFPWAFAPPLSYVWLLIVAAILAYLVVAKKRYALLPMLIGAVLAILPVALFPFVVNRFLYLPLTASAILVALAFDLIWQRLPRGWLARASGFAAMAVIVSAGSASIANAAAEFGDWARVSRVPFRNVRQAHPILPDDTLLYFFYPPLPGPNLSGMFLWQYGPRVFVGATDMPRAANLREHAVAYVYYFDEQGKQYEQRVEKEVAARAAPAPPLDFAEPIRLEGYELVSANVARGQPILLLLYWRGLRRIDKDLVVFAHLVDRSGGVVATYEQAPRRGTAATSTWQPGEMLVDAIQLPISTQVPPGKYRLAIGLYDPSTRSRVGIGDTDHFLIEPLSVTE